MNDRERLLQEMNALIETLPHDWSQLDAADSGDRDEIKRRVRACLAELQVLVDRPAKSN